MTETQLSASPAVKGDGTARLYRMIWRWHFYAGLFCIPFVIILSLTGAIYLYKPQVESFLDKPFRELSFDGASKPASLQVKAALDSLPGSVLKSYELPLGPSDAVKITVAKNKIDQLVYVHPQSLAILKSIPSESRFMAVLRNIHGELLAGDNGSLIVELAASWALVMVATGLYLWWPRGARGLAGVVWPRLNQGQQSSLARLACRYRHMGLILRTIPDFDRPALGKCWGEAFKAVRKATGTTAHTQDWSLSRASERRESDASGTHAGHSAAPYYLANIDDIVADARAARLQPPVVIKPPARKPNWLAESQHGNRMWRVTLVYSASDGSRVNTENFASRHPIDQAVGIGISAHEGQLFGLANQILGTLTALGLIFLSASAFVMWRKRAPEGVLGAPPNIPDNKIGIGLGLMILGFALYLPVLGASLIIIALIERIVLNHIPAARQWLGLTPTMIRG